MELGELLALQDGVLSRAQALEQGISARTVQRRVATGAWEELVPRVYLVDGHAITDSARVRAAGFWALPSGVVSGEAAAFWHGLLPRAPQRVEVTLPVACHRAPPERIRVRRRDVPRADAAVVSGIPVTGRELTVLETALALPDGSVFFDRALQKRVKFAAVYRSYCRNLGCRGSGRAAALIRAATDRAASEAERLFLAILRSGGVTGWVVGLRVDPWTIDVAFEAARVAVELDGWAWHVDVERFRADRRKGNALSNAGWDLLRFTWHDLTLRPAECLAEVRAALAKAAARPTRRRP